MELCWFITLISEILYSVKKHRIKQNQLSTLFSGTVSRGTHSQSTPHSQSTSHSHDTLTNIPSIPQSPSSLQAPGQHIPSTSSCVSRKLSQSQPALASLPSEHVLFQTPGVTVTPPDSHTHFELLEGIIVTSSHSVISTPGIFVSSPHGRTLQSLHGMVVCMPDTSQDTLCSRSLPCLLTDPPDEECSRHPLDENARNGASLSPMINSSFSVSLQSLRGIVPPPPLSEAHSLIDIEPPPPLYPSLNDPSQGSLLQFQHESAVTVDSSLYMGASKNPAGFSEERITQYQSFIGPKEGGVLQDASVYYNSSFLSNTSVLPNPNIISNSFIIPTHSFVPNTATHVLPIQSVYFNTSVNAQQSSTLVEDDPTEHFLVDKFIKDVTTVALERLAVPTEPSGCTSFNRKRKMTRYFSTVSLGLNPFPSTKPNVAKKRRKFGTLRSRKRKRNFAIQSNYRKKSLFHKIRRKDIAYGRCFCSCFGPFIKISLTILSGSLQCAGCL